MRRAALAAVVLALALVGCGGSGAPAPPSASTVQGTLADPDGDGVLAPAPGEPLRLHRALGSAGRAGATVATLGILSDTHVRDEESPARVPFLDRFGGVFTSTFRPQEALSTQVLAAAVRAVDRERPDAVLLTGDLVDDAQENELDQALEVLDGGRVDPDSGARGYAGVQAASDPDPFYYRPDLDPPRHPGLLAAAQRPFRSPGLRAPWYPAIGNHDVLAAGEVPPTPRIEAVATGGRMVVGIDPSELPPTDADSAAAVDRLLAEGAPGRAIAVPADPRRRLLSSDELLARLTGRRGAPPALRAAAGRPRLDYTADVGGLRLIVLDTADRGGGAAGVLDATQVAWLQGELARAAGRPVIVVAHQALEGDVGGAAALAAIDATPNVLAIVDGNTHRNRIAVRRTARGGYWEITTGSLADYPQQGRMLRVRRAARGWVLQTWMVDQDGRGLAGVARSLAYLDAQGGRPQGFAGTVEDRNAILPVPRPAT